MTSIGVPFAFAVGSINVGTQPITAAYDSTKGEIFVTNELSNNISVISDGSSTYPAGTCGNSSPSTCANQVVSIPLSVGTGPMGIVYDSAVSEMFVVNELSNSVSVILDVTNPVVSNIPIPVGTQPIIAAYDSVKGEIFVTNSGSNNVSVIPDGSSNSGGGSGIISINGDTTPAQTINGVPGSTTVSTSAGTTTIDLASIITKILTFTNNINVGANIVSSGASGSTLKIIPSTNGAICIGTGC